MPSRPFAAFRTLPVLAAAVAATLWAAHVHAEDLAEAYQAARLTDAPLRSAQAAYDAAIRRADQARAGLLPSVGLSGGSSRSQNEFDIAADRGITTHSVGVNAVQPLYRPVNGIALEQGRLQAESARAVLDAAEEDLALRLSQSYFDVLGAIDTLDFIRAQKSAIAGQLASARRNFELGTTTVTDSREAQARYDLVLSQEIGSDNDLRIKRAALDQMVGRSNVEPRPLAAGATPAGPDAGTLDHWVALARERHPALRQARLAQEVAELEVKKAEAGALPTVDLTAGYNIQRYPNGSTTILAPYRTRAASVGVQFNLPLFSGYSIQNRIAETLALREQASADLDAAERNVMQQTRAAFFNTVSAAGQVRALEAAEASSQSALDANKLGYQVGVRINIDVLNSQSQLYQTKRDLAQARYSVILSSLRLRQAAGVLAPQDLDNINTLIAR